MTMIDEESMQKIGDDIEESKKDKLGQKVITSAPKADYSTPAPQTATYQIGIHIFSKVSGLEILDFFPKNLQPKAEPMKVSEQNMNPLIRPHKSYKYQLPRTICTEIVRSYQKLTLAIKNRKTLSWRRLRHRLVRVVELWFNDMKVIILMRQKLHSKKPTRF